MTPARRVTTTRAALVLDGTASWIPPVAVITFWLQFRNNGAETLLDLTPMRSSFTDEAGAALEYDEAPVTVVGRIGRVAPGAGFVIVARHTLAPLPRHRVIRNEVLVRAVTLSGRTVQHSAGVEVVVDHCGLPTVRFTPMISPDDAPQRVIRARGG